jgi:hypothetical protein
LHIGCSDESDLRPTTLSVEHIRCHAWPAQNQINL